MIFLTSIDIHWLDTDNSMKKNCTGTINRIDVNMIYKSKSNMDVYCRSIERDYLHNHNIIVKAYSIFTEIPEKIETALENYYK
jgi:hypothetical protein